MDVYLEMFLTNSYGFWYPGRLVWDVALVRYAYPLMCALLLLLPASVRAEVENETKD